MTKRVLLTGATGFIGRHAIPELLSRGYEVHAISSKAINDERGIFWHQADLMNPFECEMLLKNIAPSHLLHFAWYAEHGKFWDSEENFEWVEASIRLMRFFRAAGGERIVMAGTCAEYDWTQSGFYIENVDHCSPLTIYGAAKNSLRQLLEAYGKQFDISCAWGRVFFLYGPNEDPRRLLSSVIISLLQNRVMKCTHGNQRRDFLHVQDAASAFVALLDSSIQGEINISSGKAYQLREIILAVANILNSSNLIQFGAITPKAGDPPLIAGDNRRLSNEVGWSPLYQIEDGLLDTVNWWRAKLAGVK